MPEINGINNDSLYFASLQNAGREQLKNKKTEKSNSVKKFKFSEALKSQSEEKTFQTAGLSPEIQNMSIDEAAIFLKDVVDIAGDKFAEEYNMENLKTFKKTVANFIAFVVQNNFEVHKKELRGIQSLAKQQSFSKYNDRPTPRDPRVQISIINRKLDEITRDMLKTQKDNLKMLSKVNEIKGLVVDLLQA